MAGFVSSAIPNQVGELSLAAYALVFLGGVLTSVGPCNLSMLPVIMGYVAGQPELTRSRGFWLSLCFTLGSSLTFVALGIFAALVRGLFGAEKRMLYYLVAAVCALIGLHLLGALKLNLDLMARLPPKRVVGRGVCGAFLTGLVVGLVGSQCATPILAAVLMVVTAKGEVAAGAGLLLAYGLGRGVPIVIAGTFTGVLRSLPAISRWTERGEKAAGVILLGAALYFVLLA